MNISRMRKETNMNKMFFHGADLLLPTEHFDKWAVIACDQFTSERSYWERAEAFVGSTPSCLRVILPEVYLEDSDVSKRIESIYSTMEEYLNGTCLKEYPDTMIYVERTQSDGKVRRGLVGTVDLDQYDYRKNSHALIRATEETVEERIPPRVAVRKNAAMELPHILLLIDDPQRTVIEPFCDQKECLPQAYNTELMLGGGKIEGYFLSKEQIAAVNDALFKLIEHESDPLLFAVGDGNHSLATAKECAKLSACKLCGRALVEVVNLHDPAIEFEPIYRVLFGVNPIMLLDEFLDAVGGEYKGEDGQKFEFVTRSGIKEVTVAPLAKLPVGTLQPFLDDYLKRHPEAKIDYIHGEDTVLDLCKAKHTAGFLFKGMEKSELFDAIRQDGSLPRKTFSMGHARDKRYYMEARRIKE